MAKEQNEKKPVRVTLDLSGRQYARLEELEQKLDAVSKAQVLRRALDELYVRSGGKLP